MQGEALSPQYNADGDRPGTQLGKGLGYFSIGLGLAELVATRPVASLIGIEDDGIAPTTLRAFGAREIAAGIALLLRQNAPASAWSRVVGDVLDLGMLALALRKKSYSRGRTIGAMVAVAGVTAVDVYAGIRQARRKLGEPVKRAITIARPPHEVYRFWRDLEQLPQFMTWVESIRDMGAGISHWKVKTPAGVTIEYDAEIIEDAPNQRIAWRSLPGASVPNEGSVTFLDAPGGRGTEVIVEMRVAAPLGKTIAGSEAQGDLHRLKQVLECGEITKSDASVHAGPHPAQPSADIVGTTGGVQ